MSDKFILHEAIKNRCMPIIINNYYYNYYYLKYFFGTLGIQTASDFVHLSKSKRLKCSYNCAVNTAILIIVLCEQ